MKYQYIQVTKLNNKANIKYPLLNNTINFDNES